MVSRKRRGSWPFGFGGFFGDEDEGEDPFGDFAGFSQMNEIMAKLMEDMQKHQGQLRPGEPIVYGVNIRVGSDGKPHISKFGNVGQGEVKEEREPLVDVINHAKEIRVIVELPGVDKSKIKLKTTIDSLSISVADSQRKFAKTLKLPEPVIEDSAKATYNNGILEVIVQKKKPSEKKQEGKEVKIQ